MNHQMLDEVGDLNAPPGSRDWAIAIRLELIGLVHKKESTEKHIFPLVKVLEEYQGYKKLDSADGTNFISVEDFLQAGYPFGLGGSISRENGGYKLRGQGRPTNEEKGYNNNLKMRGDHKPYILARLARDAKNDLIYPTGHCAKDILEGYQNGKYKSARQAGIAAGFVKDKKYIQVAPDPEKIAQKLKESLSGEQIKRLIELLR